MRRILVAALVAFSLLALAGAARAQGTPPPGAGAAAHAAPPPHVVLRRGIDRLTGFLAAAGNAPPDEVRAFLEREVAPHFDFETMARWAGGPMYHRLTPPQQDRLAEKIADLFLSALARNLGSFARPLPRVDVYPARMHGWSDSTVVRAQVIPHAGYPIHLDFRFYRTPIGWQVYDVSANGVSAVGYYRTYFSNLLRRYGPDTALR